MTTPHDDPTFAAARAFAELPVLPGDPPLPPAAGPRTALLEREAQALRETRDALAQALRATMLELEALYGDRHPSVRAARRELAIAGLTS